MKQKKASFVCLKGDGRNISLLNRQGGCYCIWKTGKGLADRSAIVYQAKDLNGQIGEPRYAQACAACWHFIGGARFPWAFWISRREFVALAFAPP